MINKKLLSFDRKALRYVGLNVLFQWLGMLCNVVLVMTVSRLIGGVFAGSLTGNALWQGMLLCLLTVPVRYGLTLCASDMSDRASKDVKRTLRSSIYAKLTRLGAGYSETVATSEAVMLASEGVEQIDTYFAKYLPQLFYSLLAPVTLFVLLVGVHARSAILLLCCVPLIPLSIVAVQKFAKKLLANYWGEYTTLGDSFLENIQGLTTLKIYQADGWKHEEMNAQAERFRKITMKVLTMQLNSVTLMDLMAYGGAGLGIISAASAFAKGQLSLTSALTILLLAADFFLPLRLLGSYFHIAMNGAASAEKIFRLLSAQEPEDGEKTADPADSTLALEQVNLADFCRSQSGLATALHEGGSNLSGGQRQRLAMARALLHDSPIYVFDEATSNVDAESENDIMKAVHSLAGKKTVILISHRLANVVDSDCIYVLEAGRIAEQGTHNDLLAAQGVYSRLYNAQKQLEDLGEVSA